MDVLLRLGGTFTSFRCWTPFFEFNLGILNSLCEVRDLSIPLIYFSIVPFTTQESRFIQPRYMNTKLLTKSPAVAVISVCQFQIGKRKAFPLAL